MNIPNLSTGRTPKPNCSPNSVRRRPCNSLRNYGARYLVHREPGECARSRTRNESPTEGTRLLAPFTPHNGLYVGFPRSLPGRHFSAIMTGQISRVKTEVGLWWKIGTQMHT